jgi:NADH-quinone oxidoreductase subunit G
MFVNPVDYESNHPVAERLIVGPQGMVHGLAAIARALKAPLAEHLPSVRAGKVEKAMAAHLQSGRSAVLLGALAMAHPGFAALRALAGQIAEASGARLGYLPEAANSAGAWLAGVLPHRGPGGAAVDGAGLNARTMLEAGLPAYLLLGVEPELDCWDGALAGRALAGAQCVVALTAFRTADLERHAHVMLPIASFGENEGTLVNAQGRWQEFRAAVPPPGEARPAWKVLRVLGNLLGLQGFEQVQVGEVRAELRDLVGEARPENARAWSAPDPLPVAEEGGLHRIGEVPIYAVDALVRRAPALQATAHAVDAAARVNPRLAKASGLAAGRPVRVAQDGVVLTLELVVDPRVPDGCVLIHAGVPGSRALGPSFGPVTLSAAEG